MGLSSASLPDVQTAASGQLCCVTPGKSLSLSEPQLLPQLNGYNVHGAFVKITYHSSSTVLSTGPGIWQMFKRGLL